MNEVTIRLNETQESKLIVQTDYDLHLETTEGNIVVVSSLYVAEAFKKRHSDVLESIRNLVTENSVAKNLFIESTYESRGKQYPEYLLTRDGFSILAMGFTGKEALDWKLMYIDAFNKMEQALKFQVPMSTEDAIIQSMELHKQLRQEITNVSCKVASVEDKLNKQLTINSNGQRKVQKEVSKRVYSRLEANEQFNHGFDKKLHSQRFFRSLYREIKNRFGISSYKDILTLEFDDAINYIKNWIEPLELRD